MTQTLTKAAERELAATSTIFDISKLPSLDPQVVTEAFVNFLDTAGTSTGRATTYNTRKEQEEAAEQIHKNLYSIDRGIYGAALMLRGTTDYTTMLGVFNLLANNYAKGRSLLPLYVETRLINYLMQGLPPQRMLNLLLKLKNKGINNARTRKLALKLLLNNPKLEYWSVKYRNKIRKALKHIWGKRTTSIIKSILLRKKEEWDSKEKAIIKKHIDKYRIGDSSKIYEFVSFILGNITQFSSDLLKARVEAAQDFEKGKILPREVMEGLRSVYHKDRTPGEVLKLTKETLTTKEKMKTQKKAKKHGVSVAFDVTKQNAVDLYIHAFETGMTEEIKEALKTKASQAATAIPVRFKNVGILVDASGSAFGNKTQKLRPMAITLATRDMLAAANDVVNVNYVGGKQRDGLIYPAGETNLAKGLVELLRQEPEAVFIVSDGYENAPAGRVNEVIKALKKIGNTTPIYQISPVMGAETSGLRILSEDIARIPLNDPKSISLGMVKVMLETNLEQGLMGLFNMTIRPLLEE